MVNNPPRLNRNPLAGEKAIVVVVSTHEAWAAKLESHLRNTQHSMRALWANDQASLENLLGQFEADLLIIVEGNGSIKLTESMVTCQRFAPNVPVLAMAKSLDPKKTIAAVRAGARDLISDGDDESLSHLVRVYERELCAHRNAKSLAQSRTRITAFESQHTNLTDLELLIKRDKSRNPEKQQKAVSTSHGNRVDFYRAALTPATCNKPRAIMMVVIDDFLALESRVGFLGAELIAQQAQILIASMISDGAPLYRISTRDFGSIFSLSDAHKFKEFAGAIGKKVGSTLFSTAQHDTHISVTVGLYPLAGKENLAEVIDRVIRDTRALAMGGGNQHKLLGTTDKGNSEEQEDRQRVATIRQAIKDNRLRLAYQSIASLHDENVQHLDVLIRMIHEDGVEIQARDFIQAAVKGGLMKIIDRWVVLRALKAMTSCSGGERLPMLFVELSEDTIRDAKKFITWVRDVVKSYAIQPDALTFKLSAIVAQNHVKNCKLLATACKDTNIGIAICHFGIGPNCENFLKEVPVQFVKFHQSFTERSNNPGKTEQLRQLIEMTKPYGLKTIVCNVESADDLARMWSLGVDYVQGFHVHRPEILRAA